MAPPALAVIVTMRARSRRGTAGIYSRGRSCYLSIGLITEDVVATTGGVVCLID